MKNKSDFLNKDKYPSGATTTSDTTSKPKTFRDCSCGAKMEQYWNVEKFQFEWYCEECGLALTL